MKGYRWRPLTRPPAAAGLTDADGFFHPDVATVAPVPQPEAVEAELGRRSRRRSPPEST